MSCQASRLNRRAVILHQRSRSAVGHRCQWQQRLNSRSVLCRRVNGREAGGDRLLHVAAPAQAGPIPQPAESSAPRTAAGENVPKRVAIFVEPTPFTYVCGYKNRFTNLIKYLREEGSEVLVITTGKGVTWPFADQSAYVDQPQDYEGARVVESFSFGLPWYSEVPLSLAMSPRIWEELRAFQPDMIHVSSPGLMVFAARLFSWMLRAPLVMSYHTHIPKYMPDYNLSFLVGACWTLIRWIHSAAHLTLSTSLMLKQELQEQAISEEHAGIEVWKKGVDSDIFHPQYRSAEMRHRMSGGHPEDPLLVCVGRLGTEKNLTFIKNYMRAIPNVRMAFVGAGPMREELEQDFAEFRSRTVFMGMLQGEELSASYASADVFVMPSESETLGFVVLEAMASGLPVVAVAAGGIPDILANDGTTGFLYPSGDAGKACELVQQLIDDPQLRARVGEAARFEVSNWDWHAATRHLLYEQYPRATAAAKAQYGEEFLWQSQGGQRPSGGSRPYPSGGAATPAFA